MLKVKKGILCEKSKCCGCGACAVICPNKAIEMKCDAEGFVYPLKDDALCSNCGVCEKACPIINHAKIKQENHNQKCYAVFLKDEILLKKCSSGGAATALAKSIIKIGGIVFGVSYTEDYKSAEYVKCTTEEELNNIRGTKYIQSRKREIFCQVRECLNQGKKVLFIGLPCEVAAIKTFLLTDYENLFTCELICHGPTSENVQKEYVEHLELKQRSKVINYTVRYKKDGWTPLYVLAEFENGNHYIKRLDRTDFFHAFAVFLRPSCYECEFKGNGRVADITIGDFWGDIRNKDYWNRDGVSAIMLHTEKGKEIFSKIEDVNVYEVEYELIRKGNPRIDTSEEKREVRKKFADIFMSKGLIKASIRTRNIKCTIKNLLDK